VFWLNVAISASSAGPAHRSQEFAYRTLYAVVLVVVPAIVQLRRPERNVAAQQQLIVTATAHMIGTFVAAYVDPLAYVLVAAAVGLSLLHPQSAQVLALPVSASRTATASAAVIAIPLGVFIAGQARLLLADRASQWEDMLVFAAAILLSLAVAAFRAPGWRVPGWTAGIALAGYGLASALNPDQASSWGRGWGTAAAIAGMVWVAVLEGRQAGCRGSRAIGRRL
jgi:hypothetical protein